MPTTDIYLKLPRSPQWPELRRQWLKDHPTCAACGKRTNLEVHHKVPVHVSRSQELEANNLITLCENSKEGEADKHCHFVIGHLGNWYAYNRNVDKNASDNLLLNYPRLVGLKYTQPATEPAVIKPNGKPPAEPADGTLSEVNLAVPVRRNRRN